MSNSKILLNASEQQTSISNFYLEFQNSNLNINANSPRFFLNALSEMKKDLLDSFNDANSDLPFEILDECGWMGSCDAKLVSATEDGLNFEIDIIHRATGALMDNIKGSFFEPPLGDKIVAADFFLAFFDLYFNNRFATEEKMDAFNAVAQISLNDTLVEFKRHLEYDTEEVFNFLGMYDFEVEYRIFGSSVGTHYLVSHSNDIKRREYIEKVLLPTRITHNTFVRPIRNELYYSFKKLKK